MRELVTYDVGEMTITAPREWSDLSRANAECELRCGHPVTEPLATLALLAALPTASTTPADAVRTIPGGIPHRLRQLAASLLRAGWRPGDGARETNNFYELEPDWAPANW